VPSITEAFSYCRVGEELLRLVELQRKRKLMKLGTTKEDIVAKGCFEG